MSRVAAVVLCVALAGCDTSTPTSTSTATSTSTPTPTSPATATATTTSTPASNPTSRRGLWIWDFAKNAPPAERAARLARDAGFHRVFIKAAEGAPDTLPPPSRWARNFSEENVAPFRRAGLEVWAFGYFYPDHFRGPSGVDWGALEDQVDVAVRNAARPGVVGIVVDAEAEFYDRGADATRLCKLLRERFPGKVAYTSFGWLSAHRRFPFKAFDEGCGDAFLPQVYSTFGWPGGVTFSMQRLTRDAAALGLGAPMWPIQSIERAPPADEIARFFDLAGPDASLFYLQKEGEPSTIGLLDWSRRHATPPAIAAD
jgi:hypothetical protein